MVSCLGRGWQASGRRAPRWPPFPVAWAPPANPLLQGGQQLVRLRAVLHLDHLLPAQADDVAQGLGCVGMLLGEGRQSWHPGPAPVPGSPTS